MRQAGGYARLEGPSSPIRRRSELGGFKCEAVREGVTEWDTFTDPHCNAVIHVPAANRDKEWFFCRNCMARICAECSNKPCIPFMKKLERAEARARALRSYV